MTTFSDVRQAAVSRYSATLVDTLTDAALATLPVRDIKWGRRLNDTSIASAVLDARAVARHGIDPEPATAPVQRSLYIYRDEAPVWGGLITGAEYTSDTGEIQLDLADWWWLLDRRILRPDPASSPPANLAAQDVIFSDVDETEIVRELVRLAQIGTNRDLGIVTTATLSGNSRDRTYRGYELKTYGELLRELANVIDGPDLSFAVAHRNDAPTPARLLQIGTPALGDPGAALTWTFGANLIGYTWPRDPSEHADTVYSVGDGAEVGTPIVKRTRADVGGDISGWPAMDAVVQASSGTIETTTLVDHADNALGQRSGYRLVIGATVHGGLAPQVGSYSAGSDARITADNQFHEVDAISRVVGWDVSTGDDGEEVTVILAPVQTDNSGSTFVGSEE